jgi:hypothetical protein
VADRRNGAVGVELVSLATCKILYCSIVRYGARQACSISSMF